MVQADQPICFPDDVQVAVSSKEDGTMLDRTRDFHSADILVNRRSFCNKVGIPYERSVYQTILYDESNTYDVMRAVTPLDSTLYTADVTADGLFTAVSGVGLFLSVADCAATIMYDPVSNYLALLHLGRHATYSDFATCAVKYFTERGSSANDIIVWMSPHASKESYRLEWFDREDDPAWKGFYIKKADGFFLDIEGYNRQRFTTAGIAPLNITVSEVDTVRDANYFSHLSGDIQGRVAVVAMMK